MSFWADRPSLPQHIDQHLRPEAREWVVPVNVGDKSASFETCLFVPPHDLLILRRVYCQQPTVLSPSTTAYWTLAVVQRIEGKDRTLATFDGSRYGFVAGAPKGPSAEDASLEEGWPVYLVGLKVGNPSSLDDLHLSLVVALA